MIDAICLYYCLIGSLSGCQRLLDDRIMSLFEWYTNLLCRRWPVALSVSELNCQLKDRIMKILPEAGLRQTGIYGLKVSRREVVNQVSRCFYEPSIIIILQGRKHGVLGSHKVTYGENECLLTGVELPAATYISGISPEKPLVSISLPVDNNIISQLITEIKPEKIHGAASQAGVAVSGVDANMLDAFQRLLTLIDMPEQKDIMAPMIVREIHYRLLIGPLGHQLGLIYTQGSQSNQIAKAIKWLKTHYNEPFTIDELADRVNMASSTFRRHFKSVATISPLQYQKRLRLHEAQRLMLVENHTASSACHQVGYESPTQFNREYKRMFGESPHKDLRRIKAA